MSPFEFSDGRLGRFLAHLGARLALLVHVGGLLGRLELTGAWTRKTAQNHLFFLVGPSGGFSWSTRGNSWSHLGGLLGRLELTEAQKRENPNINEQL